MKNNMPATSPPSSKDGRSPSPARPRRAAAPLISGELADRLKSAGALVGVPAPDLIRIGLRRLLDSIERDGFLRAGPRAEGSRAGGSALKISSALRSRIRSLAAEHGQSDKGMTTLLLGYGIGRLRAGQIPVVIPGPQDA